MNRKQQARKHITRVRVYGPPYVVLLALHRVYLVDVAIWLARRWIELPLDSRRFRVATWYVNDPTFDPPSEPPSPGQSAILARYARETDENRAAMAAIRRDDEAAALRASARDSSWLDEPWRVEPYTGLHRQAELDSIGSTAGYIAAFDADPPEPDSTPKWWEDDGYWDDYEGQPEPVDPRGDKLQVGGQPAGEIDIDGKPFRTNNEPFPCLRACGRMIPDEDELCPDCEDIIFAQFHPTGPQHKCLLCDNLVETQNTLCDGCDDHVAATVELGHKPDLH